MHDPVNAPFDVSTAKEGIIRDRLDEARQLTKELLKTMKTAEIPLLVISQAVDLAIRRKYDSILAFLERDIMLFTPENVISAFASMAERYAFLKSKGVL